MKVVKIVLLILVMFIIIAGIGLFIFIKTFDINRYKTQITEAMSQRIDRPVNLGDLGLTLSLSRGMVLNANDIEIKDSPEFSQGAAFTVKQMRLDVDILPLIKEKKINVSSIQIIAPTVTIIRNAEGQMNIPQVAGETKSPQGEVPAQPGAQRPTSPGQIPQLLVQSFRVQDGDFRFIDQSQGSPREYLVKKIDFTVKDFSLSKAFDFEASAAILNEKANLHAKGQAQIDANNRQVRVDDLNISSDLSSFSLSQLGQILPQSKDLFSDQPLLGKLSVLISQMIFGEKGVMVLTMDGRLNDSQLPLKALPLPLQNVKAHFQANETDLELPEFSFQMGQGIFNGTAKISDYLKIPQYQGELQVTELAIGQYLEAAKTPVNFQGLLNAGIKVSAHGVAPETITQSLSGQGNIAVQQGQLKDFNILKMVFSKMSMLPDLVDQLQANLPEKYREVLNRNDTLFEKISSDFKITEGDVQFQKTELIADTFELETSGKIDFKQNLDMLITVFIPKDLATSFVTTVPELGALVIEDGRIKIPLSRYQGKAANFKVMPDLEYLGKRVIATQGKEEINKLLDKVFKEEKQPETTTTPTDANAQPAEPKPVEQQKPVERQIIENVLDSILKTE